MMSLPTPESTSATWASMAIETTNISIRNELANSSEPKLSTTFPVTECELFDADYKIIPGCVCALAFLLGIMFCFFGKCVFLIVIKVLIILRGLIKVHIT